MGVGRRCAKCTGPIDDDKSRFWCAGCRVELGTFQLTVNADVIKRMRPRKSYLEQLEDLTARLERDVV